jgi:hypothetical protein
VSIASGPGKLQVQPVRNAPKAAAKSEYLHLL